MILFGVRSRRSFFAAVALAAAGLSAGAPRASAGMIQLTFDGTTSQTVKVRYPLNGSPKTVTVVPGPYRWRPAGGSPEVAFPDPTATFCVELGQPISLGQTYGYDILSVADAAGAAKADLFGKLWGARFDTAWAAPGFGGTVASSAFQLAVWELVNDGPGALDLAGGTFSVPKANLSNTGTAAGLAQSWLNGLGALPANTFGTAFPDYQLVWLSHPTAQDQLTMIPDIGPQAVAVPEPASALLMLAGLAGCGVARFRRRPGG